MAEHGDDGPQARGASRSRGGRVHGGDLRRAAGTAAQIADEFSDTELAHKAANTTPADLNREARKLRKPSSAEYSQRHAARAFRMRWDTDKQFLNLYGRVAAVQGEIIEDTFKVLVEQMRPAKGQPWSTRDQRAADALVQLCEAHGTSVDGEPTGLARQPLFVVDVPQDGPATIAGIPIADTVVEQFYADAKIELVLVDDHGDPLARSRVYSALSPKITRAVRRRDGHCRVGCCDRTHGLHTHHLWPRTWGGTDDIANLAAVCSGGGTDHHLSLVPHGLWLLLGNPNQPHGLHRIHRDDIPHLDHHLRRTRRDRAGPDDP